MQIITHDEHPCLLYRETPAQAQRNIDDDISTQSFLTQPQYCCRAQSTHVARHVSSSSRVGYCVLLACAKDSAMPFERQYAVD
jgi:hypothetical protein